MIIQNLLDNNLPEYIIIGGGPAGITLALELEKKNKTILLIEAGGIEYDEEIQSVYKGKVIGDKYFDLDVTRLRYLGGSSNHWGGNCAPLDKHDMKNWPIDYDDLNNYRQLTKEILNIKNKFIKYENTVFQSFKLSSIEEGYVNFGEKYYDKLKNSKNIFLLLKSNVLSLDPDKDDVRVSYININLNKENRKIKINHNSKIILACGGIENSRLLLWSRERIKKKFLNGLPIGKYWMEHPSGEIGHFLGEKKTIEKLFKKKNYFLVPTEKFMNDNKTNNIRFSVQFWDLNSEKSFKHYIKDIICLAPNLGKKITESISNQVVHCISAIKFSCEQKPSLKNSISLSKKNLDKFQIPRVILNWNIEEDVFITLEKTLEKLGNEAINNNIGRIGIDRFVYDRSFKNSNDIFANNHHMGGTIISNNENKGVVDKNLKVENVENLYVLGSSVFPTAGHFNPTFTIIQLSLRLAKHLTS